MAHFNNCRYCGCGVVNALWHPDCRVTALEDLIFRAQKYIKKDGELGKNIKAEILAEKSVISTEAVKIQENEKLERRHRKELWKMAKRDFMQKQSEVFEREHPDPDPPTY